MVFYDAVSSGDRRKALEAIRDKLAREMDNCLPRELAALVNQMRGVLAELDKIKPADEGTVLDELSRRRGQSGSQGPARSVRRA